MQAQHKSHTKNLNHSLLSSDEKRDIFTYIIGFLIIIIAISFSYWVMNKSLRMQENVARTINLAANQLMLSQRGSQLSYRYQISTDPEERATLHEKLSTTAERMRYIHELLTRSEQYQIFSEVNDDLYYDDPHQMDYQIKTFIGTFETLTRENTSATGINHQITYFLNDGANEALLNSLDLSVHQFVKHSQKLLTKQQQLLWLLNAVLILTVLVVGLLIFMPSFKRMAKRTREFHALSSTDPLTGCHNRRSFNALVEDHHQRLKQEAGSSSVMMLDIDRFKLVNDTHGHAIGDLVIQAMASISLDNLRQQDIFGRLGGEEFAVILPDCNVDTAKLVAEKLRKAIEAQPIDVGLEKPIFFTVSIGVSNLTSKDASFHDALNRADTALYSAKQSGRNQVAVSL